MNTRYLVSSGMYCLCDAVTQETLTYTKQQAEQNVQYLKQKGIKANIVEIKYK